MRSRLCLDHSRNGKNHGFSDLVNNQWRPWSILMVMLDVPRAMALWRMMLCVPFVWMKCIKHQRLCSHAPTVTMTSTITAWPCGWRPRGRMSSVLCAGHPGRPPLRTRPLRGQSPANISTTPPPLTSLQLSNRGRVSVIYRITTTSPPTHSPPPPATPRSPGPQTLST